jgi:threonine dehydratase
MTKIPDYLQQVTQAMIREAATRVATHIRRTPVMQLNNVRTAITPAHLWLKCEQMQVTGSFKARGAFNKILSLSDAALKRGVIAVSGGNHGIAVAHAARSRGVKATVYVGSSVPPERVAAMQSWGAEVVVAGPTHAEAFAMASGIAEKTGAVYVHPFDDPLVIAGQGTVGLELLEQLEPPDYLLIALGGGGLISGMARAVRETWPRCKIIGIEPAGAAKMRAALDAGKPVKLDKVETKAISIAPNITTPIVHAFVRAFVDDVITVTDAEMIEGCRWLWREAAVAGEMAAGAPIAALMNGKVKATAGQNVCVLVCGAGKDGII